MGFNTISNRPYTIPIYDPLVAIHFASPASNVGTLIHQITQEKIYDSLFKEKSGLTFLDIGANIGLVSIYTADACSRIVAVEPAPDIFQVLKAMTLKISQIECVNAALTPTDGKHEFYSNDVNSTASSTVNTFGIRSEVDGLCLSSILRIYQLEKVDVCKIDSEGAEGESLTYDELAKARDVVQSYYIESHNCPKTTWEYKIGQLVEHLSQLKYHKMRVNGMCLYASR